MERAAAAVAARIPGVGPRYTGLPLAEEWVEPSAPSDFTVTSPARGPRRGRGPGEPAGRSA